MTKSNYDRGLALVYISSPPVGTREYGLTFQMNGSPRVWPRNWAWIKDRFHGNDDFDIPANWTYG